MYNLTDLVNSNTPADVFTFVNVNTNGIFFGGFMIALWFTFFLIMKKFSFERSFITTSFLCFLISIFFVYGGFLSFYFCIVFATMTLFGGFWIYLSKDY
jgi:hypothetical protein